MEKSRQVSLMHQIFHHAACVYVYIGDLFDRGLGYGGTWRNAGVQTPFNSQRIQAKPRTKSRLTSGSLEQKIVYSYPFIKSVNASMGY
ncbi:hypothetical protein FOC4_g10012685 [Fusarium odoratissimum]|uniref:Uncharacterized protein n=2 Tax=Fusarium oxysporum species complex TaxID=171631 RepID=N1RNR5_FUSC4|nr:hypothetical protein FOC4_g10012685 [Fusarium odoratissimum]TXC08261.1 hypothetical protein FocTR4_00002783 [Fusarium oxysporum f. sp. cubense]